jgi:predicted MPP superfamily phosphohydrolase
MTTLDAALLRGLVARWSYSSGLHGTLRVTRHEIQLSKAKHLPAPLVLAFASDLHAGPTTHPEIFTNLLSELARQQPDVLLLGGDYVSSRADYVDVLCDQLARCNPSMGTFAVLGNHDLWTDPAYISRRLASAGAHVLINGNCPLPAPFEAVSICGIDDPWSGDADTTRAFAGAGPIRIFLSHSPDGLLLMKGESFDVGFAGHTHGGQIAFPDGTPLLSAGGPLSRTYSRGRFEIAGVGPLIVSRGIGCSNIPVRINSDPELVICALSPSGP